MEQLLPILKPSGYRVNHPLFFKENILNDPASPVVAFGKDMGEMITYESASSEEEYKTRFKSVRDEAFENLKQIQPNIYIQEVEGNCFRSRE